MRRFLEIARGFVTALRTLSILPLPGKDAAKLGSTLPWFPAAGALLGAGVFGTAKLLSLFPAAVGPNGAAFLLVLLSAVLTRGLHLDGLADAADGLFSMTDRRRTLAVMKDSRIGTFGVLALICLLCAKWLALARLLELDRAIWVVAAWIVSRAAMATLAAALPYARAEGGTGMPFVNDTTWKHAVAACLLAVLLLATLGSTFLLSVVPAAVVAWLLSGIFRRRVGGITGDLLGATGEIVETLSLCLATVLPLQVLSHTFRL